MLSKLIPRVGQASLGNEVLALMKNMVGSVSLWSFSQVAAMTSDDYQALIAGAQAELDRTELKLYVNVFVAPLHHCDPKLTWWQLCLLRAEAKIIAPSLNLASCWIESPIRDASKSRAECRQAL